MAVRSLLISAPEEKLQAFHLRVAWILNGIDRRGQTVRYACMSDDFDMALGVASDCDCSVQEIIGAGDEEMYEVRHQGTHGMLWEPAKS